MMRSTIVTIRYIDTLINVFARRRIYSRQQERAIKKEGACDMLEFSDGAATRVVLTMQLGLSVPVNQPPPLSLY